jgi:hypothetical protein
MKATFDVTSKEGQFKVFNAQSGSSVSLKNMENGEIIEVVDVLQYGETINSYGSNQEATVTVLFDAEGITYAGVSDTVAKSGEKLIDLMAGTGVESVKVSIIKQKSGRGQEFLNLRAVL